MPPLKVNDKRGNPVEIGAVVVWRVRDTAQAVFDVDDFETYVKVQAEAAIRHLASMYAYDDGEDLPAGEHTLRGGMDAVSLALRDELQARFDAAGVEVQDAKLSHLAYAPEIAQVMLRRQQAEAIVSARHKIVQGAVGMVEAALKGLSERNVVQLDDERKAGDGEQPAGGAVLRPRDAAGGQHRHAVRLSGPELAGHGQPGQENSSRCASTLRCGPRWRSSPRRSCAASTRRWNTCCAKRWPGAGARPPPPAPAPPAEDD